MRVLSYLLLEVSLQLSASTVEQLVNLSVHKGSREDTFKVLRKQSGYSFIYSNTFLKSAAAIKVNYKNEDVLVVLDEVFGDQPLDYAFDRKVVYLTPHLEKISDESSYALEEIQPAITGYVKDENGKPVVMATVRVKDKNIFTVTDERGFFRLREVSANETLIVAFLGYHSMEVSVSSNLDNIVLRLSTTDVDEVVVYTGLQKLNAERVTGSFGSLSKDQIEKPSLSIAQRIIGTTAGVQATLNENGIPRFEIRGQSSLTATATPLVVVDGFAIQGDYGTINPNDVESVTILKDAAAASIWGARAANGVIVVVTKNARNKTSLQVNFQSFARVGAKFDLDYVNPLASSAETVEYERMAFNRWSALENSGALNTNYGKQWSQAAVLLSENHLGYISEIQMNEGLERLKKIDNKSQIMNNLLANPISQQYNLSLQGSSGKMNNYLSLMYEKNQSNFQRTFNDKYLINYRTNSKIFEWMHLDLGAMLNYNYENNSGVNLGTIQGLSPYDLLKNEDGTLTNISQYYWPIMERFVPMERFPYVDWTYNPIQEIDNRSVTAKSVNTRLQGGLTFIPIKGVSYEIKGQYELFNTNNRDLQGEETFVVRNAVNTATTWDQAQGRLTPNLPKGGQLRQSRNTFTNWSIRNQLSVDRTLGNDHRLNAIAGAEILNRVTESFGYPTSYGYNDETLTLGTFPNGPGGVFFPIRNWMGQNQIFGYTNSFSYSTQRFFSVFGNAAYTYLNKYTLSGSARTDASNMITDDPKYRYAPFWSVGGNWSARSEPFLENATWLDRLNFRLTFGYNGNVDPSTAFRPLIATSATPNPYTDDFIAGISSFGNPTLRWERTGTWNFGIDYAILSNKFYGKIELYNKSGKDLIATLSIPAVNGTTLQRLNNAEMTNRGVELEFGTNLKLKGNDIIWNGSLNFSYNKNEITRLFVANYAASNLSIGGTGAYVEGYDANSMWMFEYAGVQNRQPMIFGANGELYDLNAWTPGDGRDFMLNMGTKVAPYTLGLINSFKIYNFDVSFIFIGKFGHVFRKLPFNYPPVWNSRVLPNNRLSEVLNGDPNKMVPLPQNDIEPTYFFWDRFIPFLSYLSANASHIRMQEAFVSYKLPIQKWSRLSKANANLFLQGNDLFTYVFNDVGEDPEYRLGTMNPRPKYTFGVKILF